MKVRILKFSFSTVQDVDFKARSGWRFSSLLYYQDLVILSRTIEWSEGKQHT